MAIFTIMIPQQIFAQNSLTVTNPLIFSDVPDVDAICVGNDYYMVSTTMHLSPGAPIMHSNDMKNWEIVSYIFDELHESPANDLQEGNIYGKGQWAASIKFHEGTFYVFFGTGVHSYLYTTKDPKGKWTLHKMFDRYYHDASLLFDEDKAYLVHCARGAMWVKQFKPDLTDFEDADENGSEIIALHDRALHEGVHAYKIDGRYYMTTIWWPGGGIRTELCFRSDNIKGPYEKKVILSDSGDFANHGVAQGGIFMAHNKKWYAMLFQDHEAVGRIPYLLPCTWIDGWPMLGDENGKAPLEFQVPGISEKPTNGIVKSDDFNDKALDYVWQWNHNPDNALWSLTERPGFLRLKTGKVVGNVFEARNTIGQRTEGPKCQGIVKMGLTNMNDGDHAGLFAFCSQPGGLTVVKTEDEYVIQMTDRGDVKASEKLSHSVVWLKMACDFTNDTAIFAYSTDGNQFKTFGTPFHMIYNLEHFMGNRFAIFNYATKAAGGFVDIDYFQYSKTDD